MGYAELIAGAISAIGMFLSMGKEAEAQALRERMAAEYGPEILPDLDKGLAEAQAGGPASRTEDTTGRNAQLDVLAELDDVYQTGGRTEADEAAYRQAGRKVSQRAGQRAGEISMDAARRGQTNGPLGGVLASQSGQDELEALASLDADVASDGRGRALQALGMKSSLASGVRGDDWRSLNAGADATDLMNRFNASQRAGTQQQGFQNNMQRLAGQNAARSGVAAGLDQQGSNIRQTSAGLANSALSFGQGWDWGEKDKKEDDE